MTPLNLRSLSLNVIPIWTVTVTGLVCGLTGAVSHNELLLTLSLLIDALDGRLARAFDCASPAGASLDLATDLTVLGALAAQDPRLTMLVPPLLTLHALWPRSLGQFSGRTFMTLAAVALWW